MVTMADPTGAASPVRVIPAGPEHAASIQATLGAVTAEHRWLFSVEAPEVADVTAYLVDHLRTESPYFVAVDDRQVVGLCEIQRSLRPGALYVGSLGMAVLDAYRGLGIGARLLSACLAEAWAVGMLRVELDVFADNARARRLFGRVGFVEEGVRRAIRVVDGRAQDSLVMARLAPGVDDLDAPATWQRFVELAAQASRYRQHSWISEAVTAQDSPIHGRGLFATRPIPAREAVAVMGGPRLDDAQLAKYQHDHPRCAAAAIGEGQHVLLDDEPLHFLNHSCDPNLWLADEVTIVARHDIDAGQELTVDYALYTADPSWSLRCACGANPCRGVITGSDWQLRTLEAAYADHFSPFINDRIAAREADTLA
jgi:RimJ/RimL family protein N-acetyltransferase